MPGLSEREIMWGELLRSASNKKHLSREQRFNLYREIHAMNILRPEAVFWCMDWEITSVKEDRGDDPLIHGTIEALPSDETYAKWRKDANTVRREIAKRAGRAVSVREAYGAGRICRNDVVRARPLSWLFVFKEIERFDHVKYAWTPYRHDECWYCGNAIPPVDLVTLLLADGWRDAPLGDWASGGSICRECVLSLPETVAGRATKRKRDEGELFRDDNRRSIEIMAARLRMLPSFSEIRGFDAARALAEAAPRKGKAA